MNKQHHEGHITILIVYPDASEVEYTYYDGTSLLHQVRFPDGQGNMVEQAEFSGYEPSGKIGAIDYWLNSVYTHYSYDQTSGRLLDLETSEGTTTIQGKSYIYSKAGDIKQITDSKLGGVTHTYTYDKLHRLTGEDSDAAVNEYKTANIVPTYPHAGDGLPIHAVASVTVNGREYTYQYDDNGNMEMGWDFTDPSNPASRDFEYNADNMPTRIIHETKGATNYFYDGAGQRVKKVAPGGTTYYIGDHYEVKDGAVTKYVFAGNIRLAMINSTGIYYYHKDHLGSSAAMTRADNNAIQQGSEADYLPFGGERTSDTHTLTNYAFTDQERDPESGLYNYNARLYDPAIGQFITVDSIVQNPFDPQTLNRYSYCRNNPLVYVDPSGQFYLIDDIIIGAAIGAVIGGATSAATGGDIGEGMLTGAISGAFFGAAGGIIENSVTQAAQAAGISSAEAAAAGMGISAWGQVGLHFLAGAASGGVNASIGGGDVGFETISGGVTGGFGKFAGGSLLGRSILGGVVGGISAEVYGGNFGDGFISGLKTAAIGATCNDLVHDIMSGRFVGTGFGEDSSMWYAQRYNETGNPVYAVGGVFASLWTPDTYLSTTTTLSVGLGVSG